jgi:hypothetical protein
MYQSNRNRVPDLLAGMSIGQRLPEIALAMPQRTTDTEDSPRECPDHVSLFGFMLDISRADAAALQEVK